jgi:hypothetical protein
MLSNLVRALLRAHTHMPVAPFPASTKMNGPSQRTDRQIPPGAFERWLAQGHAERREFRVRRFILPAAVFAIIAAVPWFMSSFGSRGPSGVSSAPQYSHGRAHIDSRGTSSADTTVDVSASAAAPATHKITEGKSQSTETIEKSALDSRSATTVRRSEDTDGKKRNTADMARGKPMLPEPHAVLEIRDGKIYAGQNASALPRGKVRRAVRTRSVARKRSTYSGRERGRRRKKSSRY